MAVFYVKVTVSEFEFHIRPSFLIFTQVDVSTTILDIAYDRNRRRGTEYLFWCEKCSRGSNDPNAYFWHKCQSTTY